MLKNTHRTSKEKKSWVRTKSQWGLSWAETHPTSKSLGNLFSSCAILLTNRPNKNQTQVKTTFSILWLCIRIDKTQLISEGLMVHTNHYHTLRSFVRGLSKVTYNKCFQLPQEYFKELVECYSSKVFMFFLNETSARYRKVQTSQLIVHQV